MLQRNQSMLNTINMLSDACLIFFAYFLTLYVRFYILNGQMTLNLWNWPYSFIAFVYSFCLVIVYYAFRMYGTYRFKYVSAEIFNILLINGLGVMILAALFFMLRVVDFSRWALVIYWLFSSGAVILKRAVGRQILRSQRQMGYSHKHVIIVGNGHLAFQYLEDIKRNPQYGIIVDGYVSAVEKDGLGKCLGSYEELENILLSNQIDELVVALEPHEIHFMKYVLSCADKEGVGLSLIPFFNDYFPSHVTMNIVGRSKLIDVRATPLDNLLNAMIKRAVDVFGSIILIILLSPIMIFTAIGVKLSSPGEILFTQDRVGLNKKPFKMLKFRSMKVNDTEDTGWSTNADPRKTWFGSFIRKYSIDELPQLLNVLKGDMSLVGPRPEVPFYVSKFKEDVPLYLLRQQVRPGMTGWAQVNGLRGDTSIEERVKYDIWYIENWSFWLDVRILLKTAFGGYINNEVVGILNNKEDK